MTPYQPISLARYRQLISSLPFHEQAFETKSTTWERESKQSELFKDFRERLFQDRSSVKLSRADVFEAAARSFSDGVFTTILWGYPRNMRGNRVQEILESERFKRIQETFAGDKNISKEDFQNFRKQLSGTGIGLSTLTKLLYFFQYKLEEMPCLIFDRRIIEVCNDKAFSELEALTKIHDQNKYDKYFEYLKILIALAEANDYKPDQLELFLFQFGNSLKPVNVSATTV